MILGYVDSDDRIYDLGFATMRLRVRIEAGEGGASRVAFSQVAGSGAASYRVPGDAGSRGSRVLPREAPRDAQRGRVLLRGPTGPRARLDPAGRGAADRGRGERIHGLRERGERRSAEGEDRVRGPLRTGAPDWTSLGGPRACAGQGTSDVQGTKPLIRPRSLARPGPTCPTMSRVWVLAARRRASGRCTCTSGSPSCLSSWLSSRSGGPTSGCSPISRRRLFFRRVCAPY